MSDKPYLFDKYIQQIVRQNSEQMKKMLEPLVKLQNPPVIKELQKSVEILSKATEGIVLKNQETFKRLADLHIHTGLKAFSEQMRLLSEQINAKFDFDHVVTTHLSQLLTTIDWDSIPNKDLSVDFERLNKAEIYDEIERKFNEEKTGHSGKQFLYLTIITIILQVISNYYAHQAHISDTDKQILSENKQANIHLKNIEGYLAKADSIDKISKANSAIFLEVKRKAPLRLYPDASTDSILTVFPGQFLDLIDDTKRWYKVQFVNFENGDFGTGWIYKGHVAEIREEE